VNNWNGKAFRNGTAARSGEECQMTSTTPLSAGGHDLDIDGVAMRYEVAGSGPVCLMHPGGPGVSPHYLRMPAVERHVTAVYMDPAGTGHSGRLPTHRHGYTMDLYRRWAEALIDHLGQQRVYFLGHSFGGFVAQELALRRPDLLTGIILYDTAPTAGPDLRAEAARQVDEFARRFSGRPEVPAVVAAFQKDLGSDATDEEYTRRLQDDFPLYFADYWAHQDEFGPAIKTMTVTHVTGDEAPADYRGKLHEINVRSLILAGRYDFICPPKWAHDMHREIRNSRLFLFERSGHFPHLEEPEAFAAAIGGFVSSGER
jgi:proline iminopeptidase